MKTHKSVFLHSAILFAALAAPLSPPAMLMAQTTVTTTGMTAGQPVAASGGATVISDAAVIDAVAKTPGGTDISAMINTVYTDTTLCPSANGCVIDARGATGGQLIMSSNPFAGRNVRVKLLLGNLTYIACVPWVVPQPGIIVEGSGLTGSTAIGTIIKAGSAEDGCAGSFPNGASVITFGPQHGPFGSGNYSAVIQDGGPSPTTDKFGSQWRFLTVDANNLADFCVFSASMEEKSGVFHFGCRGAKTACGFWDRAFQGGTGSGPSHFNIFDTTCDIANKGAAIANSPTGATESGTTVTITTLMSAPHNMHAGDMVQISGVGVLGYNGTFTVNTVPSSSTFTYTALSSMLANSGGGTAKNVPDTDSLTRGWVYEGSAVSMTFVGGTCTSAPHGYPQMSGGSVATITITYGGNCTVAPTSITINSINGSGFSSTGNLSLNGNQVVFTNPPNAGGSGYSNSVRGAGPWIERSTLRGTSATNHMADAIWIEGSYDTHISDIHCEWLGTNPNDPIYGLSGGPANCVNFGGSGNAQNNAGRIENVDVGNNSGGGQIVHLAAGGVGGAASSNQGTSLANIAFESVSGSTAVSIQDDTVPLLPVDSICTGCVKFTNGNGNGVVPQYISGWGTGRIALRVLLPPQSFTTNSTSLATVGNWMWTVQANKNYALTCQLSYQADSGGGLTIGASGASATVWLGANVALSANAFTNKILAAYGSVPTTVSTGATNFMATFVGQLTIGGSSGTFQVQAASTTTMKNLTINQGSWCELKDAN